MKFIIRILITAAVLLGVGIGLWLYLNKYLTRSKASNEVAKVRFSQASRSLNEGDEFHVELIVSTESSTGDNRISGVDISFITTGTTLIYDPLKSGENMPVGFDDRIIHDYRGGQVKRIMIAATKATTNNLIKSITIPLYFKYVAGTNPDTVTTLTINTQASQVAGPPARSYPIVLDSAAGSFTVHKIGPKPNPATGLVCDEAANMSRANCGSGAAIAWIPSALSEGNAEGYKIFRNNQLIKTVSGHGTSSFNDRWCVNFDPYMYTVVAYNEGGDSAATAPVSCACQRCPTAGPPTPSPIPPPSSADLIFRLIFPNALASVNTIPDIKITIFNNDGTSICADGSDCAKTVSFSRVMDARYPNTFQSNQLSYMLQKNQAYSIVVKQNRTIKRVYKNVYLKWKKVLQCNEGSVDSGCGDLIGEVTAKQMLSGDLDGSNVIDQLDLDKINMALGSRSSEGDLNFDGVTDQKDVEIIGKNFNKKGN